MADTTIKKWNDTTNQWEELYPETTVSQLIATGDRDSTTFLRGDGVFSDTLTGNLTIEDSALRVGDVSADNYLQIQQVGNALGFTFQHSNASAIQNLQGSTNQALVLGDVDNNNAGTLLGASILQSGSWTKKFNLTGEGELYIGSTATDQVWHNGNFEPIVDNLDILPGYSNSNEDTVSYNTTERAIELQSNSDNSMGLVYPALKTESGVSWKISFSIKASASATSGVYFRIQEYDSALPDGKTHISHDASHSEVQEDTRQRMGFLENQAIGTSWEQHSFFYTPTSTAVWFSPNFLNWSGLGTNALYVKNFRIFAIQEDSTDANTLDGLDSTQFVRSDTADTITGDITFSGADLTLASGSYQHLARSSYITFYGDNSVNHSIASRNKTYGSDDDIRINTYGSLYINLDSNNNNSSDANFQIGRHGGSGTISDFLLTLDGESGKLGLGTTTPSYGLDVYADGGQIRAYGTTAKLWAEASDGGQASLELKNTEGHLRFITDNGAFQLYDQTDSAERFVIDTNGNWTFGAGDEITIRGDLNLAYGFPRIHFTDTNDNSDFSLINANGQFGLYDDTNSTYRIAVESNGNVGIGTESASQKLDVSGSVRASDNMYAARYYDLNNTSYYVDPASTSVFNALTVGGDNVETEEFASSYTTIASNGWNDYALGRGIFSRSDSSGLPSGGTHGYWFTLGRRDISGGYAGIYVNNYSTAGSGLYIGRNDSGGNPTWEKVWTDKTDGSGSTLDADLLDGNHASAFATAGHTHTDLVSVSGDSMTGDLQLDKDGTTDVGSHGIVFQANTSLGGVGDFTRELNIDSAGNLNYNGNTIFHEGNDGSASGLHADLLDGQQGSYYLDYNNFTNTPSSGGVTSIKNFTNYVASSGTTAKNLPVTKTLSTGDKIGLVVQTGTTSNYGTRSQEIIWVEVGTSSHTVQTSYYATATTTARWYAFEVYISSGALYIDDAVAWTNGSFGHSGSNSSAIYFLDVLELT